MRTLSVVLVASAFIAGLSACSADAPELVRATVQTIPDTTIERPESPTIPETIPPTISPAVEATAPTTTAGTTTTLDDPDGSTPIFSTARLSNETSLDTYPVVTGEWTDRDFARVAAGAHREFARQAAERRPDLQRLLTWFNADFAATSLESLKAAELAGNEYRPGNISDFVVYEVEEVDVDFVLVNSCERNNTAKFFVDDESDPSDDKLVSNALETKHVQRSLVKRETGWFLSGELQLETSRCVELFS